MKFSFYALLIMGIFSLAACGDDDNGVALTSDNIVGTWNLTAFDSDADIGALGIMSSSVSSISNSTVTLTFVSDGTWTSEGDYTISSTVDGTTEISEETGGIGNGTYSVADGKLTLNDLDAGDESDVSSIEFDTSYTPDSKIDLNGNAMESSTDPIFGIEISIDLDLNMILEK